MPYKEQIGEESFHTVGRRLEFLFGCTVGLSLAVVSVIITLAYHTAQKEEPKPPTCTVTTHRIICDLPVK